MMKKLLAILLTLALALGCAPVFAEESADEAAPAFALPEGGLTLNAGVELNAEAIGKLMAMGAGEDAGDMSGVVQVIASIVNALNLKAAVSNEGAQADVILKDQSLLSLSIAPTEEGFAIATNDLGEGDFAITVSNETIQALLAQLQSMFPANLDPNALMEAVMPHLEKLLSDFSAKVGEPEEGTFSVDGYEFTQKVPINMTTKELVTMVLTCAKDVLSEEAIASVLEMVDADIDADELDDTLNDLAEADEADMPVLDAAVYGNEAGETYFVLDMAKDEEKISVRAGMMTDKILFTLDIMGQSKIALTVTPSETGAALNVIVEANGEKAAEINGELAATDTGVALKLRVDAQGMYIAAGLNLEMGESGIACKAELYFNDEQPLLTATATLTAGAEVTPVTLEGKTVFALEDLMSDETGEKAAAMETMLNAALSAIMGKAMQAMPDEFGMIMQMLSPAEAGTEATVGE